MKHINLEGQMGMVTNLTPPNKKTIEIRLDALDVHTIVESLSLLDSADDKFNQAVNVVGSKISRTNFSVTTKIHIGTVAL